MKLKAAIERAEITGTQLRNWTEAGYVKGRYVLAGGRTLTPEEYEQLPAGHPLRIEGRHPCWEWLPSEIVVARLIGLLAAAGVQPSSGAGYARHLAEHPEYPIHIGGGLVIRLTDWHPDDETQRAAAAASLACRVESTS